MGLKEFQIIFDSPVYHAGQSVTGKLIVDLKKPRRIKGIYLKYFGKGTVQWTEGWGNTTVTHSNTEIYLTLCQTVFENQDEDSELSEGKHVFPFSCQLPTNLPYSFEGVFGRTRYSVRAVVDQQWKNDYVAKQPMTIMSIFDLNDCPVARTPVQEINTKTFWGQSKPLTMSVDIPMRGFVPGQIIPIRVILNNESEVHVKSVTATLKQNTVFHGTMKSSPMKEFLLRTETPVEGGLGYNEITLNIQTPILPPSYLQFCNIMDVRYQLNVKAKVNGCHRSLKISTEIILGSIPLVGFGIPSQNQGLIFNATFDPGNYQPPPYALVFPSTRTFEDLPPPLYEQTMGLESREEMGPGHELREFPPLYPVQNFCTGKT